MDIIDEIRRRRNMQKQSISAVAREMGLFRPTVRKHLATVEEPRYERVQSISPKLGPFAAQLTRWLEQEVILSKPRRRLAVCVLFESVALKKINFVADDAGDGHGFALRRKSLGATLRRLTNH